jgi:hypothetical protein
VFFIPEAFWKSSARFRKELKKRPTDVAIVYPVTLLESCQNRMSIRTTRKNVQFNHPFSIEGVGRVLPPGTYEIVTDAELIEELSFPVYRRVATMILAPTQSSQGSIEMLTIDPSDLTAAMKRDALVAKDVSVPAKPA